MGLAFDSTGNLYVADKDNHMIRKITTSGVVSTVGGDGTAGVINSADATSTAPVRFNMPSGLAFDSNGTLYVADSGNHVIRKISTNGTVSTLAGTAGSFGLANGDITSVPTNAKFTNPLSIV